MPTRLPLVTRRCHDCAAERFRANGKFRVNAHHKLLDVWLLVHCVGCGDTAKLTVLERTPVRAVPAGLLARLHANDLSLAAELLRSPTLHRRNRVTLDWTGAWRLDTGGSPRPDSDVHDVAVRFTAPVPVRPLRLIAQGCDLPRAELGRLVTTGNLVSAVPLTRKTSSDFTFTLKR